MRTLITLDYELFFGSAGTPEKSIIEPTNRLVEIADKYNFKCVFFVDVGYLVTLKKSIPKHPKLQKHYSLVASQIKELSESGHEIQLHIHPHWEDSFFNGNNWNFDLTRYRLSDFSKDEIGLIVKTYKLELESITGKKIFAYRAGGWCIEPFEKLKDAFVKNKITIDSTVYYNGQNTTKTQWYNFKNSPKKGFWRFEDDPCIENEGGYFIEIPIASLRVSPFFYWKFIFLKIFGGQKHNSFGDGYSSRMSKKHLFKLTTQSSNTVVSMDGIKAGLLKRAYIKHKKFDKNGIFVIIGHPKAFSEYSLHKFDSFIKFQRAKLDSNIITYESFL